MAEVQPMCSVIRKICFELRRLGQEAHASGDLSKTEHCFLTSLRLGQCLSGDPDAMVIVRMVGIAAQSVGLGSLAPLYEQTNQTEKQQAVQQQKDRLQAELNAVRQKGPK